MVRLYALTLTALLALPAQAQSCRLALQLALDVSSSVDADEYRLQMLGNVAALRDPDVRAAFLAPGIGTVALSIFEWSGRWDQQQIAPWRMIESEDDLDAVIAMIEANSRSTNEAPTSLGHALSYAARQFLEGPQCAQRTVDVSADGPNNDGFPASSAYVAYDWRGITVNALVVGGDRQPELTAYYLSDVIRGPGAFVEVASDYADYTRALRRKLLRELQPVLLLGELR